MGDKEYTPGPWEFTVYGLEPEMIEQQRQVGMKPTRILTNDGQAPIMAGSGDDMERIALVDCQANYKRGQGHKAECAERDANARLIAAAPDLLSIAEGVLAALSYPRGSEAQIRCLEEIGQDAETVIEQAKGEKS